MQISSQARIRNPPTKAQREMVDAMFYAVEADKDEIVVLELTLIKSDGDPGEGMIATEVWDLEDSLKSLGEGSICEVKAGTMLKEKFDALPDYDG